jgi:hypothetical protein
MEQPRRLAIVAAGWDLCKERLRRDCDHQDSHGHQRLLPAELKTDLGWLLLITKAMHTC